MIKLRLDRNLEEMLIYAMRYTLGRHSYAPSSVMEYLEPMLTRLTDETLNVLYRDVVYEIELYERMGKEIAYKKEWSEFAKKIKAEQDRRVPFTDD